MQGKEREENWAKLLEKTLVAIEEKNQTLNHLPFTVQGSYDERSFSEIIVADLTFAVRKNRRFAISSFVGYTGDVTLRSL